MFTGLIEDVGVIEEARDSAAGREASRASSSSVFAAAATPCAWLPALAATTPAHTAAVITAAWRNVGYFATIFLAGLQGRHEDDHLVRAHRLEPCAPPERRASRTRARSTP